MATPSTVRACLITNPNSGRGGIDLSTVLPLLKAHGWDVNVCATEHAGHATELAAAAVKAGVDIVIACGGDGTLGETVDGVIGSDVAVGALPGGTANLWAREVGISSDLHRAALQLIGAQRRRIDVGRVAINDQKEQHFLLMAGLGIDGAVVAGLSDRLKERFGMLAYAPAIFNAVRHAARIPMKIDLDGVAWDGEVVQLIVGNTRRYASVTMVTPGAFVDDGRLDVCVLTPTGIGSIARQLFSLLVRRRPDPQSSYADRVGSLTVRTTNIAPLQLDGSPVKQDGVPVEADGVRYIFSVLAQSVTMLVPRAYNGDLFQTGVVAKVSAALTSSEQADGLEMEDQFKLRVIAVGIGSINAASVADGRVITVRWTDATTAEDAAGQVVELSAFLASLGEDAIIGVDGEEQPDNQAIIARRITREPAEESLR